MTALEHIVFMALNERLSRTQVRNILRDLIAVAIDVPDTDALVAVNEKIARRHQSVFYPDGLSIDDPSEPGYRQRRASR